MRAGRGLSFGSAYRQVRDKLKEEFVDLGEKKLKNIERPVRVYSLASSAISLSPASLAETPKPSTDQPSVAVLPFTCFSEEREFKFLTEAMTEDLITMLARIPGFIVIARQSSFAYQGRTVDSREIGRELGVRYIVEGSLRPIGGQLRVGAQLIDAKTGAQLWADRFDGQAENVLELQDQIARAIASRIEPELVRAEIALIRRRRDANPNAWSCFLEGAGVISLKGWSEETLTHATALLRQATALDPDFALARARACTVFVFGRAARPPRGRRSGRDGSARGSRTRGDDRPRHFRGPGLCRAVRWRSWAMCEEAPRYWSERSRTIRAMHRHGSRWGPRYVFSRIWDAWT